MAERIELDLEFTHPYKASRLLVQSGRAFFGRWHPFEVQIDGDEEEWVVREGEEGQLDLVAEEVYGTRELWRIIAHANHIDFALEEVTAGTVLTIPKLANVYAALQQTVARSAQIDLDEVEA